MFKTVQEWSLSVQSKNTRNGHSKMTIEKSVPVPFGKSYKYPFSSMAVGDSFVVENDDSWKRTRNAAHMFGKRNGMKFKARACLDGLRIWRIL